VLAQLARYAHGATLANRDLHNDNRHAVLHGSGGDQTMVMVIFTICCLILIAIVWPRAFFGTLGVLFVALILIGIGVLLIESPVDKRETARQAAPVATYAALQRSQREAEEKRKSDDWARETQPALVVRRSTVTDAVGLANRRDVPRLPDVSFGDSRLPDVSF
jgi:hypothetical protein